MMIDVSQEYKNIMARPIRNKAYISASIGIINHEAQNSGKCNGDFAYWSHGNVFNTNQSNVEYATLESNYLKADGTMLFVPENDELLQLKTNGITTVTALSPIKIEFPNTYAIKGITLDFGSAYPIEFKIQTAEKTMVYTNDSERFETSDVLGDTNYIMITPIKMIGGSQRFRIRNVLIGNGLLYTNKETKNFRLAEYVSPISEELPHLDVSFVFFDEENRFNVDDDNSFVDYLDTMQEMEISFGLELDNGEIEWHKVATAFMKDWNIRSGQVTLNATDRLSHMEEKYSKGNKLYSRTAYEEAESILQDAGLTDGQYIIDEYLKTINLVNPMPEMTHKECLQLLANACRCAVKPDVDGRIVIYANFATVLDVSDFTVKASAETKWSNSKNIFKENSVEYAELTNDFLKTDGSMYFMPDDDSYKQTSFVSNVVCNSSGVFSENPKIEIQLPASFSYYEIGIDFLGNPPKEMTICTYNGEELIEKTVYNKLEHENKIKHDFLNIDKIVFEFTKGYPNNRVLINNITFGEISDYILTNNDMTSQPIGYKEERVKVARAKIFTYESDSDKGYVLVEDNNYADVVFGSVGTVKTIKNPLIHSREQALLIAEWIGNHFANNISYDVEFRGDPRLNAADIIRMENGRNELTQVEITDVSLSFNGKFGGSLEMRRALSNK